ncbi:Hsp20/alpha crystallin family protein [Desulfosarcina ovata]|uniref:Molecular chaperone Hsp20 n=2 Tax=Desulfosarcina ovata TaxID=83564 RepID=A0A5K8A8R8_9BACT|nr:Hsp20/alpha crystallin family protein [Desulfosarcina ovata]BBO81588.1 molecular chaperone Hsp20 [Desulfosarcina ovata subsp. sediminis]BBO88828.1 molecular chaperone Hsp20 [Desulfosarcina ovata subsp. ovata]
MIYRTLFGAPGRRFGSHFGEFDEMRRQMDRLFSTYRDRPAGSVGAGVFPAINITEDTDAYYVSAELPGVKSADLDLNVTANQLTLAGERKISKEADARYHRREREAGRFSRAVALPGDIDAEGVKARLTDGVLSVTVPKAEKAKPRQIAVQ